MNESNRKEITDKLPLLIHWKNEFQQVVRHINWSQQWKMWLILISSGLATTWLAYHATGQQAVAPTVDVNLFPDYTLINFTSFQMDEQGLLKNQLIAKTMNHYPTINTKLTEPFLIFYKDRQPVWDVRAQQGEVSPDGNQAWLLGQTTLQRLAPQQSMQVISKDVWVQLDREYAETAAHAIILKGDNNTEGVGMRAFLATEQLDLLSQARGYYVFP
jgi:lipopolysaccharide export system protein LptC